ncbi:MAG: hypothetical protein D6731_15070 [Planctomycetota bacterium]|nr:MAG: hypothetical protein D6731_15070 [Planctomycetota bacterium]
MAQAVVVGLGALGALPAGAQGLALRGKGPAPGTRAPDFSLRRLAPGGEAQEERVALAKVAKERPVALVFGSYT